MAPNVDWPVFRHPQRTVVDGSTVFRPHQSPTRVEDGPRCLADGATGSGAHLRTLRRKLRRERTLARAGHHAYDITRHLALVQMIRDAERRCARERGMGCENYSPSAK